MNYLLLCGHGKGKGIFRHRYVFVGWVLSEFNGPVNTIKVMSSRSVYLTIKRVIGKQCSPRSDATKHGI